MSFSFLKTNISPQNPSFHYLLVYFKDAKKENGYFSFNSTPCIWLFRKSFAVEIIAPFSYKKSRPLKELWFVIWQNEAQNHVFLTSLTSLCFINTVNTGHFRQTIKHIHMPNGWQLLTQYANLKGWQDKKTDHTN